MARIKTTATTTTPASTTPATTTSSAAAKRASPAAPLKPATRTLKAGGTLPKLAGAKLMPKAGAKAETAVLRQPTPEPKRDPAPAQAQTAVAGGGSKQAAIIAALRNPDGMTIAELMRLTGWLSHSVRGMLSGGLRRKLGLVLDSRLEPDRGRVYRIVGPGPAAQAQDEAGPTAVDKALPAPKPASASQPAATSAATAAALPVPGRRRKQPARITGAVA